jgi:hypothetical protein
MNAQVTTLPAENKLKQLMADVSRAMEKAEESHRENNVYCHSRHSTHSIHAFVAASL